MGSKDVGHGCKHTGLVVHLYVQVVFRNEVLDRGEGDRRERADGSMRPLTEIDRSVDHVAKHGARSWHAPGASPVEHELSNGTTLDEHGIERVAYRCKRVRLREHHRMDPDAELFRLIADLFGHGEELDHISQLGREGNVGGGDRADPFTVHVARHDPAPERDAGDDRRFGRGVVAFDIGRGVALGIAETLGFGEGLGVGRSAVGHLREDVVGGAVHDAHHPGDLLPDETLAQRPHERNTTGHRSFKEEIDRGSVGGAEELRTNVGQQFLVTGDGGFTQLDRLEDQRTGRLDTSDELDHDVDVGRRDHGSRVVAKQRRIDPVSDPGGVTHGDVGDDQVDPGPGENRLAALGDQVHQGRTDVAASKDAYPNRSRIHALNGSGPTWPCCRFSVRSPNSDRSNGPETAT